MGRKATNQCLKGFSHHVGWFRYKCPHHIYMHTSHTAQCVLCTLHSTPCTLHTAKYTQSMVHIVCAVAQLCGSCTLYNTAYALCTLLCTLLLVPMGHHRVLVVCKGLDCLH